jgi:hypothetical protein
LKEERRHSFCQHSFCTVVSSRVLSIVSC